MYEMLSSFNSSDDAKVDNSPIMMVKCEGQVVQVLEPPTGDKVSLVNELLTCAEL